MTRPLNSGADDSFNWESALLRQRLIVAARLAAAQTPTMGAVNVTIHHSPLLPTEVQGPTPSIANMLDQLRLAQQQQLLHSAAGSTASLPTHLDSVQSIIRRRQLALLADRQHLLQQSDGLPNPSTLQFLGSPTFSRLSRDTSVGGMSSSGRDSVSCSEADIKKKSSLHPRGKKQKAEEPAVNPLHLKKKTFAESVYLMLQEAEEHNGEKQGGVISYVANGSAFMIHKPSDFETDVMPMYFKSTRMASFQRQLAIYGFKRIERDPHRGGAYQHEYFHRDKPELLTRVKRYNSSAKMKGALQKQDKRSTSARSSPSAGDPPSISQPSSS